VELRVCRLCKERKILEKAFRSFKKKNGFLGYRYICYECELNTNLQHYHATALSLLAEARKRWHSKDPVARSVQRLKGLYGLGPSDYDALLRRQSGVCALCQRPPHPNKRLVVYHDHITEEVRGLLHSQYNVLLGMAGDDPAILELAKKYLLERGR